MPYTVYVIECVDGTLYTGITNNLERRLKQHRDKKGAKYTFAHEVKAVVYKENSPDRGAALRREAEIKSWRRDKKLALINKARASK